MDIVSVSRNSIQVSPTEQHCPVGDTWTTGRMGDPRFIHQHVGQIQEEMQTLLYDPSLNSTNCLHLLSCPKCDDLLVFVPACFNRHSFHNLKGSHHECWKLEKSTKALHVKTATAFRTHAEHQIRNHNGSLFMDWFISLSCVKECYWH